MNNDKEITIGLLGHSTKSENFGIGALTVSHIALLESACEELGIKVNFRVFEPAGGPEPNIRHPKLDVVPLRTRQFLALRGGMYSKVKECDIIFDITGGDSFADIYGVSRFVRPALGKVVVLIARRPLVLSPQTIGPFRLRWTQWIAKWIMLRARVVVVRDDLSSKYLRQLGLGEKVIESTDVAFRLPYVSAKRNDHGPVRVGLNISGLLYNGGYTRSNMFELAVDYPELARSLVRNFAERKECELHLISHVISDQIEVEDDYRVAQQLCRENPGVVLAPKFRTPSEAKSYISGMDFFCGSRMHACIAAFSSGVPVLPLSYSRKFSGLFGTLGYSCIADCQSETTDQVIEKCRQAFADRAILKKSIDAARRKAEERLGNYDALLRSCFMETIRGRN